MAITSPQVDFAALVEQIADPLRCSVEEAVPRAKEALVRGEPVDLRLGELVSEELSAGGSSLRLRHLLGIIGALDGGQHILKARSLLLAHADPYVRSKATLILGRAGRNADWVMRRLLDPDARVQASAVESVWAIDTPEMRKVLDTALRSPHSRVVANGLIGLYRLGDVGCIPRIFELAEHSGEAQRLSARWVMGETGDPRFLGYLNSVFRTDPPRCRAMVIRALAHIRRNVALLEQAGKLHVEVLNFASSGLNERRMELGLLPRDHRTLDSLAPTDFVIEEDGRPVTRYSAVHHGEPDVMVSGFVIPRILSRADPYAIAIESALRACMGIRRKADLWSVDRYCCDDSLEPEDGPNLAAMRSEDPLIMSHLRKNRGFLAAPEIIEKFIDGPGHRNEASRDVLVSAEKVIEILSRSAGERHLFVCLHPGAMAPEDELAELEQRLSAEKVILHGVLPAGPEDATELARICAGSGGTFSRWPAEGIADGLARIFAGLLNRYDIAWWPPDVPGQKARLQIVSRAGCADFSVDLA
jgi:hypothetical protein